MAELGVVIFTALDYGLKDEEERQLSPALENVIDLMTSAGEGGSYFLFTAVCSLQSAVRPNQSAVSSLYINVTELY